MPTAIVSGKGMKLVDDDGAQIAEPGLRDSTYGREALKAPNLFPNFGEKGPLIVQPLT